MMQVFFIIYNVERGLSGSLDGLVSEWEDSRAWVQIQACVPAKTVLCS